jgi:hypothetical protein
MGVFGAYLAVKLRDPAGLIGGALCLTPYAHAYDLAPLAPIAAGWLFERARFGWSRAVAGGALLAGLVATPAAVLAFFAALAVIDWRWRPAPAEAEAAPALGR